MTLPKVNGTFVVVKEPEIRFSPSGTAVLTLRLKANKRVRDSNGTWSDGPVPLYIDGTVFGRYAENVCESVLAGETIVVDGTLERQEWTDNEGVKREKIALIVDEVGLSPRWGKVIGRKMQENEGTAAPFEPTLDAPPF